MAGNSQRSLGPLAALGVAQFATYLCVAGSSFLFVELHGKIRGPILVVVGLLSIAFILQLTSLWLAVRRSPRGQDEAWALGGRRLSLPGFIIGFALLFRGALVWTFCSDAKVRSAWEGDPCASVSEMAASWFALTPCTACFWLTVCHPEGKSKRKRSSG